MTTSNCIFCSMAGDPNHPAPIFRDGRVFVLRDINPKARVHLLIIPNQHLASLDSIDPWQIPILGHMFLVAQDMARREGVEQSGYRLALNQGPDSGQEIEHLHLHLLAGQRLGAMG